ncbi:MAG: PAS domain S-box protein [Candidatus Hydrogenedentes bacterium]|nr:PAS domain S-box protein [Candidatus Hydrogenedentota bacterium]
MQDKTPAEPNSTDMAALAEAMELFTRTTQSMEEAYRALEARIHALDTQLDQKNRELAVTTDYLSSLLESISDGVVAIDPQGRIMRFNRAAATILGYQAEDVIGQTFESLFHRSFAAPRMPGAMEMPSKSGRMVPVNERDSTVCDEQGRHLGKVKTFQDLSELIALREQVRQIDRLAAIGEMAATVAHEIRNPLGGIRGFAAFLAQDLKDDPPKKRLVDKILAGTASLEKVVSGLLEYTRPVELSLKPVGCAAVVQDALRYLDYDPRAVNIFTEVDTDLRILADSDRIRQVVMNIVQNGIQSLEKSGEIRIDAEAGDTCITLHIRDTGCGIPPEALVQVFSPFYTTREKGTGLGLAICKKIIDGHGGALTAASEPGKGSTFSLSLPRAE